MSMSICARCGKDKEDMEGKEENEICGSCAEELSTMCDNLYKEGK